MSDTPVFHVRPVVRCFYQDPDSPFGVCGSEARWERRSAAGRPSSFYCDVHRGVSDAPIAGDLVLRRVSVQMEVIYAATSPIESGAKAEAVARLEAAARASGGTCSIMAVNSQVGRFPAPVAAPATLARGRGV